jgi:5-methylcytosine-specific restriction endonuclease McrA
VYRTIDAAFWTDMNGNVWPAPRIKGPLNFSKFSLHAKLRAFVFSRDHFTCQKCGTTASSVPDVYDGRKTLQCDPGMCLVMDHILSRRNGGSHHPENLQTYCDSCNARKSGLVDSKAGKSS